MESFLRSGSRRIPAPSADEGVGKDIQCTALISDLILTAEELGNIKRMHWSIENRLHHVLDDTFREDRSPAKKSRNNLALIRKYAYNILRLAMNETGLTNIMTEMMDCFCDDASLRERYVFQGIASLYWYIKNTFEKKTCKEGKGKFCVFLQMARCFLVNSLKKIYEIEFVSWKYLRNSSWNNPARRVKDIDNNLDHWL